MTGFAAKNQNILERILIDKGAFNLLLLLLGPLKSAWMQGLVTYEFINASWCGGKSRCDTVVWFLGSHRQSKNTTNYSWTHLNFYTHVCILILACKIWGDVTLSIYVWSIFQLSYIRKNHWSSKSFASRLESAMLFHLKGVYATLCLVLKTEAPSWGIFPHIHFHTWSSIFVLFVKSCLLPTSEISVLQVWFT